MTSNVNDIVSAHLSRTEANGASPKGWEGAFAELIRETLRASDVDLKLVAGELERFLRKRLGELLPEDRNDLLDDLHSTNPSLKQCYRLGQLGLAHLIVAQAAARRADGEFEKMLASPTHRQSIEQMYYGEKTTSQLAALTGKSVEQTSRNLSLLRDSGVSEFRRVATQILNFLTPPATQAFEQILDEECLKLAREAAPTYTEETSKALAKVSASMSKEFRTPPSFVHHASPLPV